MARNQIKKLLKERNLSVYKLIRLTGLSSTQLYELVNQDEIPGKTSWDTLKKIRDALNLECVDQLESKE